MDWGMEEDLEARADLGKMEWELPARGDKKSNSVRGENPEQVIYRNREVSGLTCRRRRLAAPVRSPGLDLSTCRVE